MEKPVDLLSGLEFDHQASDYILQSAKWSRFLALLWFIVSSVVGLFMIIGIVTDIEEAQKTGMDTGTAIALGVLFPWVVVVFVGNIFRWRFATRAIRALREYDQQLLIRSLKQLKLYTKYCGIASIVSIGFVLIGITFNTLNSSH